MNNIKIELELPEFEKELSISVTLKKDGEIVSTFSSPSTEIITDKQEKQPELEKVVKDSPKTNRKKAGGNMMDIVI